jgi:Mrp family chromosome partitioning ATPase
MVLAGGSADKVGNEFEWLWILRRLVEMLEGESNSITVEPFDGEGAELWVQQSAERTLDQVKFRSSGTWTMTRLINEDVLTRLTPQFEAGHQVLLVLTADAESLDRLCTLAKATASMAQFESGLGDGKGDFAALASAWKVEPEHARDYLQRCTVRVERIDQLRDYGHILLRRAVLGDPQLVAGVIRDLVFDRLNQTISAQMMWSALRSAGFEPAPRLDPGPSVAKLRSSLERLWRRSASTEPSTGLISRTESSKLAEAAHEGTARIMLVHGKAGSGKSTVVAEAARALADRGHNVAAIRLDQLTSGPLSSADVGLHLGLSGSPVLVLSELASPGLDGVLLIDQLDAVSTYSGRIPEAYAAIEEMVHEARLMGNVTVIAAVRTVDLEEDPRLRGLASGKDAAAIEIGLLDESDLKQNLTQFGIDPSTIDAVTFQLIRLPIQLYVFSQLDSSVRTPGFATLNGLYEAFTKAFRKRLSQAGIPDEWPSLAAALVERMNTDELLSVPGPVLDVFSPQLLDNLVSSNVLLVERGRYSFFHETYFDYLFARAFRPRGAALIEWFQESGQGLFRRAQLRQVLTFIAMEEPDSLVDQTVEILASRLRPHLVSIALTALESFQPSSSDWQKVEPHAKSVGSFSDRLMRMIAIPRWFAAIDTAGGIDQLLDGEKGVEIGYLVAGLSADFPDRTLELLGGRLPISDDWRRVLRRAIDIADSKAWVHFVIEHAGSGDLDVEGEAPFDLLDSGIYYRASSRDPQLGLELLAAALDTIAFPAAAVGRETPGERLDRHRGRRLSGDGFAQIAESIPREFCTTLLPLIVAIAGASHPGEPPRTWRHRFPNTHRGVDDELFFAFDSALTATVAADPESAREMLEALTGPDLDPLNFLVCRAMHGVEPSWAVSWLLSRPSHLQIGWASGARWETRRLIEIVSRSCSEFDYQELESALMTCASPYELRPENLRWRGMSQLELLSGLPADRLSEPAQRRLEELHRKFPHWVIEAPPGIQAGTVRSPISDKAAPHLSDIQWLNAFAKYSGERHSPSRDFLLGGAWELSTTLGTRAEQEPTRFVGLGLKIPSSVDSSFLQAIVRSVAGKVEQTDLLPLLQRLRASHPEDSGRTVVSAIEANIEDLHPDTFDLLLSMADDPDPSSELAEVETSSGKYFGGDYVTAGINSARGAAASAIAKAMYVDAIPKSSAEPVVDKLVNDRFVSVRCLAAEAALAFSNVDREKTLVWAERLLDDDDVLATGPAQRLLRWVLLWSPDRFGSYLRRALEGRNARGAGSTWANCYVNGSVGVDAPGSLSALAEEARVGVAEAVAGNPALATDLIAEMFEDEAEPVRKAATSALRNLDEVDSQVLAALLTSFVTSRAFEESSECAVDALADYPRDLPEVAIDICERSIAAVAESPRRLSLFTDDVVKVIVRLYRSGSDETRERCLDLIDRTVLLDFWRLDHALEEAR